MLRLDLSNSLLGMALVLGGLASLMTSLQLGSAFLFAAWAAAALLGMPAAGRVRKPAARNIKQRPHCTGAHFITRVGFCCQSTNLHRFVGCH